MIPSFHVTADSREVKPGSIFFALTGAKFDGHLFAEAAAMKGAIEICSENPLADDFAQKFPQVKSTVLGKGARRKFAERASEMYDFPSQELQMIGVTGTSGKTTTTYLIQHLLNSARGARCARMGTNGAEFEGNEWNTENTTPDPISLHKWFREVLDLGATHVVMEVSSHSLVQDRAWGIAWDACAFLNLSPEHLDYHSDLDEYFSAKSILFKDHAEFSIRQGKTPALLSNGDSAFGVKLKDFPNVKLFSASREVTDLQNTATGLSGKYHTHSFHSPLFGTFQIENILAAVSVVNEVSQLAVKEVLNSLSNFPGVPGRMEFIQNNRGILAFVDYAHKPEALQKVLQAIRGKRIITVFGCGGDRDKTKRPVMGGIAAQLSDYVILTSDNPRTEDPKQILKEVAAGIEEAISSQTAKIDSTTYEIIEDRRLAIARAVDIAKKGDIILIAGKGHEDYQIFGTEKRHFDDREELRNQLQKS